MNAKSCRRLRLALILMALLSTSTAAEEDHAVTITLDLPLGLNGASETYVLSRGQGEQAVTLKVSAPSFPMVEISPAEFDRLLLACRHLMADRSTPRFRAMGVYPGRVQLESRAGKQTRMLTHSAASDVVLRLAQELLSKPQER